ncbi:MAG: hypothetical protein WA821_10385, partial [Anaerolineales bacterium]
MATNRNNRLDAKVLLTDDATLAALKTIGGYQPFKPELSVEALTTKQAAMRAANEVEVQAQAALDAARDAAVAAQWDYHNSILGAKDHVVGQFGSSSDQVAALGLKKKSERKAPARKSKA